ncbi:DUF502 domain-containing protein [Gammaproteobacteria bacterium]|jgi:uncharacterized membrane protein|nr:DUF502 domain-containing protein [Pseudomonadota bacterium]MDC1284400.1 DUF502 domain-containing protein [Gammaproteobacteria bacterium]
MLRRYLIAGLLVWVPLGVTFFVLKLLLDLMDKLLLILPIAWRPESLLGFSIPGLGFILAFIILLITGAIGANLLGRTALRVSESLLSRIPLVRTIYSSAKQILNSVLSTGGDSFRKVLLIEYPRKGIWTICFQTGTAVKEIQDQLDQQSIMVFVPTTPNPTSGFIMVVAEDETRELDMDIETALKLVMSLGMAKTSKPDPVDSR